MTKLEAKKLGCKLLKMMKGKNWKLRIWENLGWHYSVYNGFVSVNPDISADRNKFWGWLD